MARGQRSVPRARAAPGCAARARAGGHPDAAHAAAAPVAPGPAGGSEDWAAAPDRDGWHAADEPPKLRGLLRPWRARLIVAGVATVLSLLSIALGAALFGGDDPDRRAVPPAGVPSLTGVSVPGPTLTEAAPASVSPSASPSRSGSPAVTATPRSSPPPTYGPVTFEAEAAGNTLGGSAWVDRYPGASGGSIVRNIGDWGSRDGDGSLRFENVNVPAAGTYTLRLFHVNIDNERTRTAVVTVAGRDPQPVTLNGSATCCTGSTLKVQLRKGGNAITVSNPDGHAPSVDRIVLSLP
ncbi:hypothetical protein OHA72_52145 [Dactylosporangium sp. NBC_01737]|uniref:hypothetical protein n=1 Tax=Dactylosporangium sp. NBC_01737 TaxID=2975959 RepID=UPI002E13DED3|nr:hypothetical protein OHA72_52145 [Dactylosporangium sp. NBC_01737]